MLNIIHNEKITLEKKEGRQNHVTKRLAENKELSSPLKLQRLAGEVQEDSEIVYDFEKDLFLSKSLPFPSSFPTPKPVERGKFPENIKERVQQLKMASGVFNFDDKILAKLLVSKDTVDRKCNEKLGKINKTYETSVKNIEEKYLRKRMSYDRKLTNQKQNIYMDSQKTLLKYKHPFLAIELYLSVNKQAPVKKSTADIQENLISYLLSDGEIENDPEAVAVATSKDLILTLVKGTKNMLCGDILSNEKNNSSKSDESD